MNIDPAWSQAQARRPWPSDLQPGGHVRFCSDRLSEIRAVLCKPEHPFALTLSPFGSWVEVNFAIVEHAVCRISQFPRYPAARALPMLLESHVKIRAEGYLMLNLIPEFQALILNSADAWLHIQLMKNPRDRHEITCAQHIAHVVIASEAGAAAVAEGGQ
jgi:hypothetical protein